MKPRVSFAHRRAGLVLTALLVSSCGGSAASTSAAAQAPSGNASGSITVEVQPSPSEDAMKALAPEFTKETGIAVKFVEVPYNDATDKLLLDGKSATSAYDVVQFDSPFLPAIAAAGELATLDQQMNASAAYDVSDFSPKLLSYGKYQGVTYGLSLSTEPYVLWYRTDLFQKLGLQVPTTWDQYLANAQALSAAGFSGSGLVYGPNEAAAWFMQMLRTYGTDVYDPKTFQPLVDSPAAIQATNMMMELLKYSPSSVKSAGADDLTSIFIQQDVGQMIQATGYYSIVIDPKQSKVVGKFAMALPPNEGTQATMLYGWLIGMTAKSQNPSGAWAFLQWMFGKANAERYALAGAPPPARKSLLSDPKVLQALPYIPVLVKAAEFATPSPQVPEFAEITALIGKSVNAMATGQISVADGLMAMSDQIHTVFANSGRY